jgi:DNA-directed RNA polymerase subunit RPC12/RpoP
LSDREKYKLRRERKNLQTRNRFFNNPEYKNRKYSYTKQWKKDNPNKVKLMGKRKHTKKSYNLTLNEYLKEIENRNYKCDICSKKVQRLNCDHDHKTGKIRGFLCTRCNIATGFHEDYELSLKILPYIETNRTKDK